MTDVLAELRAALQTIRDARRVVVCQPNLQSRVKDLVNAMGVGELIEVRASSACPRDQLYIIDPNQIPDLPDARPMKRSDIDDQHVIDLADAWRQDPRRNPGVVQALIDEGVPPRLALAKVEHLIARGLLECGASVNYAWPIP